MDFDKTGIESGQNLRDLLKTEVDHRDWMALAREHSRTWMKFWIRMMHKHGYSNAQIAEKLEIKESSILRQIEEEM